MKTNGLCDAPTSLAFTTVEGRSGARFHPITLAKDGLWHSASRHSGVSIEVLEGLVWITTEGDPQDHVLHEGESFQSKGRQRVVAQSLGTQSRMLIQQ